MPSSAQTPLAHTWVVSHIEADTAAIEVDGTTLMTVPVWMLPQVVREGDVMRVKHDRRSDRSIFMIVTDDDERRRRLSASRDQTAAPSPADHPGDIRL